ncbi:MAG TPA: RloB family protein [Longimicrobium sp.]|nr:RloB family protein [Longimicrobium sp.]
MARRDARGDRDRPLRRRAAFRDPLPLMLVVCEGQVTEPQYFDGFRHVHGASTVRVVVKSPGGDPRALVERAVALRAEAAAQARRSRDPNLAYDEVWCVFDVDEHARADAARLLAEREAVHLAVSNPCFELWLLLHLADHAAHVTAAQAGRLLRKHLPGYDKHLRFDDFAAGYADAARRAESLGRRLAGAGRADGNPSTGVYRLTERIREFGKGARL